MLSPISAATPTDIDRPKSATIASKEVTEESLYTSQSEDVYMKLTSKDGDVLEVHANITEESFYSKTTESSGMATQAPSCKTPAASHEAGAKGAADSGDVETATDDKKSILKSMREWAKQVKDELHKQQAQLLQSALKHHGKAVDAGGGRYILVVSAESETVTLGVSGTDAKAGDAANGTDATASTPPGVPDYWNAENTSDRIVKMATSFAKISGMDPKQFAETIKKAVADGFDQAQAVTGTLPGAAGKLNSDTKKLVFQKLGKWLDDYQATAYNHPAESEQTQATGVQNGTQDNIQLEDRPVYRQGQNWVG